MFCVFACGLFLYIGASFATTANENFRAMRNSIACCLLINKGAKNLRTSLLAQQRKRRTPRFRQMSVQIFRTHLGSVNGQSSAAT